MAFNNTGLKLYRLFMIYRWSEISTKYVSLGEKLLNSSSVLNVAVASNHLQEPFIKMWNVIVEFLNINATYKLYENDDDIVVCLQNGCADVVLGSFVNPIYSTVEISMPLYESVYKIHVQLIRNSFHVTDLLKTFTVDMWILTAVIFFLFPTLIWIKSTFIFDNRNKYFFSTDEYYVTRYKNREFGTYLLNSVGSISEQGWDLTPDDVPNAVLAFTLQMFGTIMSKAFSATMIAYLMAPNLQLPFEDVSELRQMSYKVCTRGWVPNYDYFDIASHKMNINNMDCPILNDETDFELHWCDNQTAFLESTNVMVNYGQRFSWMCPMGQLPNEIQVNKIVFLQRPNEQLSSKLKSMIIRLYASGVKSRITTTSILNDPFKFDQLQKVQFNEVSFQHVRALLTCFLSSLIFSVIIFSIECVNGYFLSYQYSPYPYVN